MASTRTPRSGRALAGVAAAAAATLLLATGGGQGARATAPALGADAWRGLVGGERAPVAVGQRTIVVLRYPSLADRVARAGGRASESQMRRWTAAALAGQKQIAARLSREGVLVVPDFVYTRTLNGFAAALDARALALLERDPDVRGVYPVRTAYPAALGASVLERALAAGAGRRPALPLPGANGRGVTVALLDTGVDRTHPFLRGRVRDGIDLLDADSNATPHVHPADPGRVEQHGTELAGLVAGADGPAGLAGVAPGAWILPIRVAGWQPDAGGGWAVYARTDQLLAGLERAVDPDADGDPHDAARIALVGVAEPFAAFAEGALARAAAGAAELDTLVVAPAGNDGPAGPGFGSVAGPGGAPAALTVGAADERPETRTARVVLRAGLDVLLDRELPLAGAIPPARSLTLAVAQPRTLEIRPGAAIAGSLGRYFDDGGFSLVAGRAALVAGSSPVEAQREAALAGAAAVLVERAIPAGALGLDGRVSVPVVGIPSGVARAVRAALAAGRDVTVSLGASSVRANEARGRVAPFSSRGLAFGGGLKPELVAAGVELATAQPGRNDDRTARYGTINGTSAAAAVVAGAAALVADARPALRAEELKSVLVGTARPLDGVARSAQGAGAVDPGAAAAAEVAALPAAVSFGIADRVGWEAAQMVTIRNVSTRRVVVELLPQVEGVAGVTVDVKPRRVRLARGRETRVALAARASFVPRGAGAVEGRLLARVEGGGRIAIPWAVAFVPRGAPLLSDVRLSTTRFRPSDNAPAVLSLQAGQVLGAGGRDQLQPVSRLDVELWRGTGRVGLLARLRDVLPGRYSFGLTGRGPLGRRLPPGRYRLRIVALPAGAGVADERVLPFAIR